MAFRRPVNKKRSAAAFRKRVSKTHIKNIRPALMRGGIRL